MCPDAKRFSPRIARPPGPRNDSMRPPPVTSKSAEYSRLNSSLSLSDVGIVAKSSTNVPWRIKPSPSHLMNMVFSLFTAIYSCCSIHVDSRTCQALAACLVPLIFFRSFRQYPFGRCQTCIPLRPVGQLWPPIVSLRLISAQVHKILLIEMNSCLFVDFP